MVVTTSIRLERILLHSRATSISSPGMDNMIPSCVTGTPTARNMIRAANADCCCRNSTIQLKANSGMGTIQEQKAKRKQKRLKSSRSKTKYDAGNPPGHEGKHAERQPDIIDRGRHPPSRITTDQQRQSQQRRTDARARLRIDPERFRIPVFRIRVRIEVFESR